MGTKTEIELNNFFIFNSQFGNLEGEEQNKILFYYPLSDHIDTQIRNIGLAEAIIQFTGSFKPDGPVQYLHTEKRRQYYYQAEDNFWVVMTLNVPFVTKLKEEVEVIKYLDEEVHDNIYESILRQSYLMYRLFSGKFLRILEKFDVATLKMKIEQFFIAYIASMKLQHYDILNVFNGIQFLPLDKKTFLDVQCFVNSVECNFPIIKQISFLYNDHLIWSGIEPDDMQVIYQYLITTLLPTEVGNELLSGSMPRTDRSPFASLHHGRFITGPENLKTSKTIGKIPKVHLYSKDEVNIYYLVVYRIMSASVCLFIKGGEELSLELFKQLDDFMGTKLLEIVSDIGEYCNKQVLTPTSIQTEVTPRFIYFNKLNLAYKSTVHLDNRQTGNLAVNKECVNIMADINNKKNLLEYAGETIIKTMNDYWVVGKVSNMREFYVALQQKKANLIDISDDVKKLCDTELKGIFFHSV